MLTAKLKLVLKSCGWEGFKSAFAIVFSDPAFHKETSLSLPAFLSLCLPEGQLRPRLSLQLHSLALPACCPIT